MTRLKRASAIAIIGIALFASTVSGVDRSKFKTCQDSGFCRRNRDRVPNTDGTESGGDGVVTGTFRKETTSAAYAPVEWSWPRSIAEALDQKSERRLEAKVRTYQGGIMRVSVSETGRKDGLAGRYSPEKDVLVPTLKEIRMEMATDGDGKFVATSAEANGAKVVISQGGARFGFEMYSSKDAKVPAIRGGSLLFEDHAKKPQIPEPPPTPTPPPPTPEEGHAGDAPEGDADGAKEHAAKTGEEAAAMPVPPPKPTVDGGWEEYFGGSSDPKPNGPGAVGLDIEFPLSEALYGIPEHASSIALKDTHGTTEPGAYTDPYRLYNLDVFEYELDNPMALYGAVPLILAHGATAGVTVGMLWLNPSETWIDVIAGKKTRWISEDGNVDVWLLPGPTPRHVFEQYAEITGTMMMPPKFAIAYHQCRWNYRDEADVTDVDATFDKHDIPYDVIWLDIEHTDSKKYFTWDSAKFPGPETMQDMLASKGRKLVTIVDPHIKRDDSYYVHSQATSKDLYVTDSRGAYEGSCWPGSSSWVDFTNPDARAWWASLFSLETYRGSTDALFLWNDMNEPSVFSGPEVTMHKDALHHGNVEHRQLHNMYGFFNTMASHAGLMARKANTRPFILTRSFFAGSQRFAAVWTGDNTAKWEHLKASVPMILSLNLAGISFSGADVGGFFGNPDTELLVRWYQAGAFYPFFRGHAHIETKRREPWVFGEPTTTLIKQAIRSRYVLLPYWYTVFRNASVTGFPIARPLWVEFPADVASLRIDDEFMLGRHLLVHPVTASAQTVTQVYLPPGTWFDAQTLAKYEGGRAIDFATPIERGTPVFIRGGAVVPKHERPRRASRSMARDPYTLVVAPDSDGNAEGELYIDDGASLDYIRGAHTTVRFEFHRNVLSVTAVSSGFPVVNGVERIVFAGVPSRPGRIVIATAPGTASTETTQFDYDAQSQTLTLRKPIPKVDAAWKITILPK